MIGWRRVGESDFDAARGEEPSEDFLTLEGDVPFGLVQRCRLADYPGYLAEFTAAVEVPEHAMTIDYLIGASEQTGRGIGPAMLRSFLNKTWTEHPTASAVLVGVPVGNRKSWRALEKAGLNRIAEAEMIPDNPRDSPEHYICRTDRPHQ